MKQIFTCLVLLWACLSHEDLLAASPTVPSSNFSFFQREGNRLSFSWTNGNGARRIIVMKAGAAVTGLPVNGAVYTASQAFGNAGARFTAPDEYVVADGISGSYSVTNLQPGTTYHVAIFEYNGTGANTEYLTIAGTTSNSTVSSPTVPAAAINFSAITGNGLKIDLVKGNGSGRLIVMRKNDAITAEPADLQVYPPSVYFGNGAELETGSYAVYANTGTTATIQNLEPGTDYHVSVYEYNGNGYPVYLKPALRSVVRTAAGPSKASSNLSFSNMDGNRHALSFTPGNGAKRLVIGRKGQAVSAIPVNGANYTASLKFGSGSEIAPGEFVLSNAGYTSFTVTDLEPASEYHYAVFDFDGTENNTHYLTSNFLKGSTSTVSAPTVPASDISFTNIAGTRATIGCTRGNGSYRLIVLKEGTAVDAVPVQFTNYTTSTQFGSSGSVITPGNHAVMNWTGNTVTVTNLKTATTYHVAIFEYNGPYNPIYLSPATTASFTTTIEPTGPVRSFSYTSVEGNSVDVSLSPGNGSRRLVIAKKEGTVDARPVDGTAYTANKIFGSGAEVIPGEFVVYDGAASGFEITALEPDATYHLAAFEYNLAPDGTPDYLVDPFGLSSFSTQKHPTVASSNLAISSLQNTQVTVQMTPGNGSNRLGVLREASLPGVDPADFRNYITGSYGSGNQTGAGNYAVLKSGGSSGVIGGLQPGTTYTLTLYEFNGVNAPVYLVPGSAITFTTSGVPPLSIPDQSASNAVYSEWEGNAVKLSFTKGNGARRLVVLRKNQAVSFLPAEGNAYTANAVFGTGTALRPGEYAVLNDNSNMVNISGLEPESMYQVAIFEYNTDGTAYKYQNAGFYTSSFSTLPVPATGAANLQFTEGPNSIGLSVSKGGGSNRLIVAREGAAIGSVPADLSVYPANNRFGNGSQIEPGSYVVYAGSGNTVSVNGLMPGKTYHFSVFEYNGTKGPVYNKSEVLSGSVTMHGTLPLTWGQVQARTTGNAVIVQWSTLQEVDTERFEVERSTDGSNYRTVHLLPAAGNSGTLRHYSYRDADRENGRYHYRIKQIDKNGDFSYSKIITVQVVGSRGGSPALVYPNPALDQVSFDWKGDILQAELLISDAAGKIVLMEKIRKGEVIGVGRLLSGLYYCRLRMGALVQTITLIKQ